MYLKEGIQHINIMTMKRILFTNPDKNLFFLLKRLGITDFDHTTDPKPELKGIQLYDIKVDGISENALWGNYDEIDLCKKDFTKYATKYMEDNTWISATIDLSEKGIETLKQSGIKNWKIQL